MHRFPRVLASAIALAAITTSACQGASPTGAPTQATNPAFAGQKTGTIKGRVTQDGVQAAAFRLFQAGGVGNATVTCQSGGVTTEVKTDAQGNFAVPAVQGTEAIITATHSDATGKVFREVTTVQVPTAAEPPIVDVASLVTRRTGSIQGMVTLAGGQSPEGVDVFVGGTTMIGKASEKGRFALANVPEGIWDIVIQKTGFGRAVIEDVVVKAGRPLVISEPVTLVAEEGGLAGVKAAIRDGSGKAVVGATMTVFAADGASTTATSDGQGNVSVSDLPDGDYTLQVYRSFYQPVVGLKATVKGGALTDLGEIKLQSTTMYFGQASGQVVDEYGDPVDGAVVMLDPPVTEQIFTDAQGRFTLDRIMPGEYTLHIAAGGMEVASEALRIDNAPNTKITFDEPVVMRQAPGAAQAGVRQTDLLPPLLGVGTLPDQRVALYWEPTTTAQLPLGIVSVHYEVEHLDDAVGSQSTDPANGDWKQVAAKADISYVLESASWNQDMFRVRAVGLDAAGVAYVSNWQELSLREPTGRAAGADYRVAGLFMEMPIHRERHPGMVRGKTGVVSQPKPNKPEVQLGMDVQKPPVTRKPATTAESLELLRSLEEHRKKLEEVQRQVLAQYGAPKPVKKKAKRKGKGFHRDRRRGT